LFLARRTINTHLASIYTELGINSRSAATRFAAEHGLT
jgi:DNA-binding NarL/FixJ family response regulator